MKAVFCTKYGPPEVLEIRDIEKPVPKDYELLIKIHAATVAVADVRIRAFDIPKSFRMPARFILGFSKPKKPILGVEFSGEIESIGKKVTSFKKGQLVFAATLNNFGAHAEYICVPENGPVVAKPASLTHAEAAALPVGGWTPVYYLKRANIQPGQKVLIYGASGSVGTFAVQLAKYYGAEVTGVCSAANLEMVKSLGADKVIDYTSTDFPGKLETYDIIFMAVDKWPFADCIKYLTEQGTYVNVTMPFKTFEMRRSGKNIVVGGNPPQTAEVLLFLKQLVEEGKLKVVLDRSYKLDQIAEAHRYVDLGHKKGSVGISVS